MPKFLKQNLSLKIICVLIGIALWGSLKYTVPLDYRNQYQTSMYVPIVYMNEPEGLKVIPSEEQVLAEIKGSPEFLSTVSPSQFSASVDLKGLSKGVHTQEVRLKFPPGVTVTRIQPSRVKVTLETFKSTPLPITLEVKGSPAFGYSVQSTKVVPDTASVSGSVTDVEKVRSVVVGVDVSDLNSYSRFYLPLRACDDAGRAVNGVALSPQMGTVLVKVGPGYRIQTVNVAPSIEGAPPDGFEIAKVSAVPPMISVRVPEGVEFKSDFVKTAPIDVSGIKGAYSEKVRMDLPDRISIAGNESVKVFVNMRKKGK